VPTFLLDANLSPRVAKHLSRTLGLDVVALQGKRLGDLSDHAVIDLAQKERRVIITLDRDFSAYFRGSAQPTVGVIWMDIPNRLRFIPTINALLERFFREQAGEIDLDHSLVVIGEDEISIYRFGDEFD
jgi:predicted nuclease of predicted toxin-antitoxin system